MSGLTSQLLNGTYEFSELALARMALLMDHSRSVLPLKSAKAQEFGKLRREKMYTRSFQLCILNGSEPVLFGRPNGHMGSDPRLYKSWNHPNEPVVTLATTNLSKSSKDVNTQKGLKFTICPFIFHFKK